VADVLWGEGGRARKRDAGSCRPTTQLRAPRQGLNKTQQENACSAATSVATKTGHDHQQQSPSCSAASFQGRWHCRNEIVLTSWFQKRSRFGEHNSRQTGASEAALLAAAQTAVQPQSACAKFLGTKSHQHATSTLSTQQQQPARSHNSFTRRAAPAASTQACMCPQSGSTGRPTGRP
jgi:hypothetical protein